MKRRNKEDSRQLSLFGEEFEGKGEDMVMTNKVSATQEALNRFDHQNLFERLAKSTFRSRFHLGAKDRAYVQQKGLETIRQHAEDFVSKRLAPAYIPNDGKQTPMRGHPVFLAQHATGCCCRGCFCKWHHIPAGRALSDKEQAYAVSVLMAWIMKELEQK